MNIYESVRKEYYKMNVLDVATDHPIELLRIFFSMFEKQVFKLPNSTKQSYINNYKYLTKDGRNPWLDNNNRNIIEFDTVSEYLKKQKSGSNDEPDNYLSINFSGTRAIIGIKNNSTTRYKLAKTWNISNVTVEQFFNKLLKLFKNSLSIDRRKLWTDKEYLEKIKQQFPDLYEPDNKVELLLNKMWNKHNLIINTDFSGKYKNLKVRYQDRYFNRYDYNMNIRYSFQLDALKKFMKYIIKFLNNRNIYISTISSDPDGLTLYLDDDKDRQLSALEELDKIYNQYNVKPLSREQYYRNLIKEKFEKE